MRRLLGAFAALTMVIAAGCQNPVNGSPSDGEPGDDAPAVEVSGFTLRVVTDIGPVSISGTTISGFSGASFASVDQEVEYNVVSRGLADDSNIVDYRDFGSFMFLLHEDGTVLVTYNNSTATNLNVLLGVDNVYLNSTQLRNGYAFIGADNVLYRVPELELDTASSYLALNDPNNTDTSDNVAGMLFSQFNDGTNEERVYFMVDSEGNDVVAMGNPSSPRYYAININIDGSTVTSDESSEVQNYPFSETQIVIAGDRYYRLVQNRYYYVDNSGVSHYTEAATEGASREEFFASTEERMYLSDHEFYFTNGRYDVEKIGNAVIPMTSTFLQNWFIRVYEVSDTDRWYVKIADDNSISIYHVVFTGSGVTGTLTYGDYSDFVAVDNTVNDFWIDGSGTVHFQTEAPSGVGVRYTSL